MQAWPVFWFHPLSTAVCRAAQKGRKHQPVKYTSLLETLRFVISQVYSSHGKLL